MCKGPEVVRSLVSGKKKLRSVLWEQSECRGEGHEVWLGRFGTGFVGQAKAFGPYAKQNGELLMVLVE